MKIDWRRRSQRQFARAHGIVVLWRDGAEGREALVLTATTCGDPGCDCLDVGLEGLLVGYPFTEVRPRADGFAVMADAGATREPPVREVLFTIEVRTGVLRVDRVPEGMDGELRAWVAGQADDELLDFLYERLRTIKGLVASPDGWRRLDWEWWEPWLVVPYDEAFPDARLDGYVMDGRCYMARLSGCVDPVCTCDQTWVEFHELPESGTTRVVGSATLDAALAGLPERPVELTAEPGEDALVDRLWRAFRNRHQGPRWLASRLADLREFGGLCLVPDYRSRHVSPPTSLRVGRNDPCPCGSGKKFKKCCGGKLN